MPVFNLYSKRKKKAHGAAQDVFVYDDIPLGSGLGVSQPEAGTVGERPTRLKRTVTRTLKGAVG